MYILTQHNKNLRITQAQVCGRIFGRYIYRPIGLMGRVMPMARESWVQSQVESYQSLKTLYLIPPCLTLSIIMYVSRIKWSNPRKWVAPSQPLSVVAIEKGTFGWPQLDTHTHIYIYIYIYIYTHTHTYKHNEDLRFIYIYICIYNAVW